jgi:xylulokinase
MRSVIPGLWHPLAYIAGGGQALVWYRDQFFNAQHGIAQTAATDLFLDMTQFASRVPPGADGLLFSPHLGGRICPAAPDMRGAWLGFSWSHSQAHFARAILESIAYEYAYYLSILRAEMPALQLHETRVIGGGARSAFWNQIKADVLRVPYQRLQRSEFGTWGAAMIAGKAAGIYDDLVQVAAEHAQPDGQPFTASADAAEVYQRCTDRYIRLQHMLAEAAGWLRDSQAPHSDE